MVAKISVGSSLYGAIAYNGEKINEAQGRLLTTNRIYNDGSGTVDIGKAMEGFLTFLPPQMKIEKPVVHISLNPHPEDVLTRTGKGSTGIFSTAAATVSAGNWNRSTDCIRQNVKIRDWIIRCARWPHRQVM